MGAVGRLGLIEAVGKEPVLPVGKEPAPCKFITQNPWLIEIGCGLMGICFAGWLACWLLLLVL